ncbi:hypothetical protein ACI6Q5_16085 [Xanthomonas codiaei]|uniref:DUF4234 domain-containing protein n=1 Tax=Xanthomonas codiaei TaxID=56463 RepID=A0A2S7CDA7_9XANT|nr:hypothetical protein [Xanthomonas codiaei]PPU59556.1 hypothetical protein XcodCFBP4690_19120 [Xanthomonas codiaei]
MTQALVAATSNAHAAADPLAQRWEDEPLALLFAPSNWKLVAMFVSTFGAYGGYWFYRNWIALRAITARPRISPVWRTAGRGLPGNRVHGPVADMLHRRWRAVLSAWSTRRAGCSGTA